MSLKKLPPAILVMLAVELVFALAHLAARIDLGGDDFGYSRWSLAAGGVWTAYVLVIGLTLFDLAATRTGRTAVALRSAGVLTIANWVIGNTLVLVFTINTSWLGEAAWLAESYSTWAIHTTIVVALVIAGWRAAPLAIAGGVLAFMGSLPPFLARPLYEALAGSSRAYGIVNSVIGLVHLAGTVLLLVAAAQDDTVVPRPNLAVAGFRRAASALWLRVIAAAAGVMLTFMAIGAHGSGGATMIKLALFGGLLVNMISFFMFGLGALAAARSRFDGIPRVASAVAAVLALWCAGVMLDQLPQYYRVFYGDSGYGDARDELQSLTIVLPLVATAAGALMAATIGTLARARNATSLPASASSTGVTYVLLMLASIGIQSFLLESAHSEGSLIGMMVAAAVCGLIAQVILAKLCTAASVQVDSEPGLPPARVNDPT